MKAGNSGPAPLTRGQLIGMPFGAALVGGATAGFFSKMLSPTSTLALAAVLSITLGGLTGWVAYRSDFAARHGLVGSALMLCLLGALLAGSAVMTVSMAGAPQLASLGIVSAALTLGSTFVVAAVRQYRQLDREGPQGPWPRANLNLAAGTLRDGALVAATSGGSTLAPGLVLALGVNIPLMYRGFGVADAQAMPWVLALLALASAWACTSFIGPMAGKAWYLLQIEKQTGRRFEHEHYGALQALRRGLWLSRWLMSNGPESH